jgi:hypothetical protein
MGGPSSFRPRQVDLAEYFGVLTFSGGDTTVKAKERELEQLYKMALNIKTDDGYNDSMLVR